MLKTKILEKLDSLDYERGGYERIKVMVFAELVKAIIYLADAIYDGLTANNGR